MGRYFKQKIRSRSTKERFNPSRIIFPSSDKVSKFFTSSGGDQVFALGLEGHVYGWGNDKYYQLGVYSKEEEERKEQIKIKREVARKKKQEEKKKEKKESSEKSDQSKKEKKTRERKIIFNRPQICHAFDQYKDVVIKKIAGGTNHTVFLDDEGNAYSWGRNNFGQLGLDSDDEVVKEPTKVNLKQVVDISCGANHTLFLLKDGSVYGCGLSRDHRLSNAKGKDDKVSKPTIIVDGEVDGNKVVGISCGKKHNLIIVGNEK